MAGPSHVDRLKAAYKLWHDSKGAAQNGWLELLADHVQIRSMFGEAKALAFAAPRHSKSEAVAYLTAITQDWTMVHWTPKTYLSEGDKVAVFGTCAWTYKKTGKTAETLIANLWEFENGKVVSFTEIFDSARAVAAAQP